VDSSKECKIHVVNRLSISIRHVLGTRHRCSLIRASPSNETLLPRHHQYFSIKLIRQIISGGPFHPISNWTDVAKVPQIALAQISNVSFPALWFREVLYFVRRRGGVARLWRSDVRVSNGPHYINFKSSSGHRRAYKIRIISSFRGLPASATSSLIKTNSCLTQSYPAICEVLQAELCPQIILTPFNGAVMLIRSCQI
jgi:hypothetical protein